jgi:hypothetical protein
MSAGVPAGHVLIGPGTIEVGGNIWHLPPAARPLIAQLAEVLKGEPQPPAPGRAPTFIPS